jgi:hypothetical protein
MVLFLFNCVIYVFLLLWLCILIVCLCMATLTGVFPCFFLSCKANARLKPAKTGHGPHSSKCLCCFMYLFCYIYFCVILCIVCFVSFSVLFVCICVLYDCHRVVTQLQLNISYHISRIYYGGTARSGPGCHIMEASRSHSDTLHSVGLPWTSDQPDVETWQHTTRDGRPCL